MEKLCPIHNQPMEGKEGKYGYFWSHRLEDGTWCNGKTKNAPYAESKAPTKIAVSDYNGRPKEFWDRKSKIIALCGLANATISAGKVVDVNTLGSILRQIEDKATELTLDENGPGF